MSAPANRTYTLTKIDNHLEAVFNARDLVHPRKVGVGVRLDRAHIADQFMLAQLDEPKKAMLFKTAYRDIVSSERTLSAHSALQQRLARCVRLSQ
jgi:hypothetical protein